MARVNGVIGGSGKKFYYHNDHLGSALAVTDENGNKVVERDFTPFGERINTDIYDETDRDADEDDSAFTGKDWDEDVGLYYYNARWYDPGVGSFISEDSVADDPNLYGYCGQNPINFTDPTGHFKLDVKMDWLGGSLGVLSSKIDGLGEVLSGFSLLNSAGTFFNKLKNLAAKKGFKTDTQLEIEEKITYTLTLEMSEEALAGQAIQITVLATYESGVVYGLPLTVHVLIEREQGATEDATEIITTNDTV